MDANYITDEAINTVTFDLSQLQPEHLIPHTFEFGKVLCNEHTLNSVDIHYIVANITIANLL